MLGLGLEAQVLDLGLGHALALPGLGLGLVPCGLVNITARFSIKVQDLITLSDQLKLNTKLI